MILVVDDEEVTRRSLSDILRLEGYQVSSAAYASEAIRMIEEAVKESTEYEVILLDLRMPAEEGAPAEEQSGLSVLRYANQKTPNAQVIFLTAHGSLDTAIEALRHSALDYLLKPSSPEQILASIAKAVERRQLIEKQRSQESTTSATLAITSNIAANMAQAMSNALTQLENSIDALRSIQTPDQDAMGEVSRGLKAPELSSFLSEAAQVEQAEGEGITRRTRPGDLDSQQAQGKSTARDLKRPSGGTEPARSEKTIRLGHGMVIDLSRREIWQTEVDSNKVHRITLTPTEGRLMQVFVENPGKVFSHRELVTRVQGYVTSEWEAPEVLRPLISRLRRKLEGFPSGRKWIRSIRGTGYVFDIEDSSL